MCYTAHNKRILTRPMTTTLDTATQIVQEKFLVTIVHTILLWKSILTFGCPTYMISGKKLI